MEIFSTGARRKTLIGKGRYDLLSPYAIHRLALVFEEGARQYDDRNWEKGFPMEHLLNHALYHIFAYMKNHPDMGRAVYDPKSIEIDESAFNNNADWKSFYGDVQEELPPKMPKPRGNPVAISAFVDANHAGNVIARRSHTGIIIFVQNAPIIWFSKKQNTVESATFGSEFVALRTCKDMLVALRCKLRMFGVPVDGPVNVFCDNRGVVKNASIPESALMKKHNSINYHSVREAAAAGILRVGKEDGQTNLADLLTEVLSGQKRWELCWCIMW